MLAVYICLENKFYIWNNVLKLYSIYALIKLHMY